MTNNQRFAAELIVLLTIGAALWSKASPVQQDGKVVPEVLTAHTLIIVDKNGTPRAKLTAEENASGLVLLDKDGKIARGKFVVYPDPDHQAQYEASGPTLSIADKSGQDVAILSTRSSGAKETTFLHLHRGEPVPMHIGNVGPYEDIDLEAGDDGTAGMYMISVPRNKPSSWAQLAAKENGKSEVIATKFTSTSSFEYKVKPPKGKR